MNTYHHLSPDSEQLISIVYEFAEKELKNKGVSFNIFMYGIILSVATFVVCHLFFGQVVGLEG